MPAMPILNTERLVLRPFVPSDAPAVQSLAGDPAVADTTENIPHPYEDGMAEAWIASHQTEFDEGSGLALAITLKTGGALIGAIGLRQVATGHKATLGYWIGKPYWNNGFCTEAAARVLQYAFEEMDLERVEAYHLARNPASGRVMRKIGMNHEGHSPRYTLKCGALEDVDFCGILREDWLRQDAGHDGAE